MALSSSTDALGPAPPVKRNGAAGWWPWLIVAAFLALASARIVSTYEVFTQTFDEPFHIACGMEWLEKGTYQYERQHPPLSRIAVALPLYLQGLRGHSLKEPFDEGNAILYSDSKYVRNLALARAGNLPFFIISGILLALWAYRWFGQWTAVAAVGLFSFLPPVLGHAALATTDMAAVAGLEAALFALSLWLEHPTLFRCVFLGVAVGFACITKFSVIPFLVFGVICVGLTAAAVWLGTRRVWFPVWLHTNWLRLLGQLVLASLIACVLIWSAYRFSFASVVTGHGFRPPTARLGRLAPIADHLLDAKLPLGEYLGGIGSVFIHNQTGHESYLLNSVRKTGWWYFFPVVLGVKTPLAFLVLLLIGVPLVIRQLRRGNVQLGLPLLFAAGVLLCCMLSSINLGVRHILPIYPLLALVAAQGLMTLLRSGIRSPAGVAAIAIVVVFAAESVWPHPDYLASFNVLAGRKPEKILVGSDLDWGQDLQRLATRLHQLEAGRLKIAYFGTADLEKSNLPPFEQLGRQERAAGWIACSATTLMEMCASDGSYCWLQKEQPLERVGRSIFLFHLAGSEPARK